MVGRFVYRSSLAGLLLAWGLLLPATPTVGQTPAITLGAAAPTKPVLVTVQVDAMPLDRVLRNIAMQAGLTVAFGDEVARFAGHVTVHVREIPVGDAFTVALSGTGLRARFVGDKVVFVKVGDGSVPAIHGGIAGKVIDAKTRQGLRGATISLGGTNKSAMSGDDGSFRVADVASGTYTVHARMLGYVKTATSVTVVDGQTASIEVVLAPSVNALDQVVVTGTVVSTALKAVPNAMTVITAKDIEQRGITRIDQLFRGDVPGVFSQNRGATNPLDSVAMYSRGGTEFRNAQGEAIKTYVDGVEMASPVYLSQIDPQSVERIEILTGPQASTIYGSNAINGVMQIFTKRGTSTRPQLVVSLLSGFVENNFWSALTPQHDYSAQIAGIEGRWSYNAGGSWNYMGAWTPAKQTARYGGFAGVRTQHGPVTADANLRLTQTLNNSRGGNQVQYAVNQVTGWFTPSYNRGLSAPTQASLNGQTLGLTLGYTPLAWWSHELVLGRDASRTESRGLERIYLRPSDTLLTFTQGNSERMSIRYSTTAHVPITSIGQLTMTVGADGWRSESGTLRTSTTNMTGTLTGTPTITRQPLHNTGGFVQTQFGIADALFLTFGLRAEWNPEYGEDAIPNLAPRYGVAYSRDLHTPLGDVTAKLRASYGRSTRPPDVGMRDAIRVSDPRSQYAKPATTVLAEYGDFEDVLANPDLGPEFQRGGEGGLELYFGSRGSLMITRYNQTVDDMIWSISGVDSARSLLPYPSSSQGGRLQDDGYGYWRQRKYLNAAGIRNQGWELKGTANVGPIAFQGAYSFTKSRVMGVSPEYRRLVTVAYLAPGAIMWGFPEHTWMYGMTYGRGATSVSLNFNGTGKLYRNSASAYFQQYVSSSIRLTGDRPRFDSPNAFWDEPSTAYTLADLNATHRLSRFADAVLQVNNLSDFYQNDYNPIYATMGRQTKVGLRLRW